MDSRLVFLRPLGLRLAPAVIPAPIAYIKVVAVKKLVVGFWKFMDVGWDLGGLVF